jgi:putative SOS response-associated peptidase YedK
MCYSALVLQSFQEYLREMGAMFDYAQAELLLLRRLTDKSIRVPRGFERNFDNPKSAPEKRIKDLIDQHRAATITYLEQDLFAQKKRLADAERKLKTKETKAALNDRRIAAMKIETYLEKLSLLKGSQAHPDDNRIFPLTYAPIVMNHGGENSLRLARYHLRQKGAPASVDREAPGLYNARRDNLERFWRREFGHTHALMVVDSFFENVDRGGKNVILHFTPRPAHRMLVACLYAQWSDPNGSELLSFAAITDEPPEEVRAAGHDRCIINIKRENTAAWLTPEGRGSPELQAILSDRQLPHYEHEVMAA